MTWAVLFAAINPLSTGSAVSPVDAATGTITGYVLNYGVLGIVVLAFAFRFIVPARTVSEAVNRAREEAREDLIAENKRLIEEKTRAEAQRDDALRIAQNNLVPLLTNFTATTSALLPLLQELVSRRESHDRERR